MKKTLTIDFGGLSDERAKEIRDAAAMETAGLSG